MAIAMLTDRAATGAVPTPRRGAGCTRPIRGGSTYARLSYCSSRSAASVRGSAAASAPRTSTTSSTTRAIGQSSATEATSRAFAIRATAAKQRARCTKIARKIRAENPARAGSLGRTGALGDASRGDLCRPAPARKSFGLSPRNRGLPHMRDFFPTGVFGQAGASGIFSAFRTGGGCFLLSVPSSQPRGGECAGEIAPRGRQRNVRYRRWCDGRRGSVGAGAAEGQRALGAALPQQPDRRAGG